MIIQELPSDSPIFYRGTLAISELSRLTEVVGPQRTVVTYSMEVSRDQQNVMITGVVRGQWDLSCDRCLEIYTSSYESTFEMAFLPEVSESHQSEMVLSLNDLDCDFYSGDKIALIDLLEDQVLLELPMKMLCSEDCKGRCSDCGINLNQQSCQCSSRIPEDHPFAVLSKRK
ncbi:DUF177 domain-containing protein [Deltaproteobacteria bacterium TL4]